MNQLSISLPNTLYEQLTVLANGEGISLGDYILYALTRQATLAYTSHPLPENNIVQQRTSFNALCQNLGHASSDEISTVLAEREVVKPETELNPDVIKRLQKRIAEKSVS
jgi:hypothetical protein